MIELQVINKVLATKKFAFIKINNINADYFNDYKDEFKFIDTYYDKYNTVPDTATFLTQFPSFELLQVNEPDDALLDALEEEYLYRQSVPIVQEAARLLTEEDARKGIEYIQSNIDKLARKLPMTAIDLVKEADERYRKYIDRIANPNSFYITTGFKELDDILGGWDLKGEYASIVARTNHGKSWWLDYFVLAAAKSGKRVGLYSGEMSADKVGYRMDTLFSHISNYKITRGYEEVQQDYGKCIEEFKSISGNIFVITPADLGGPATVPKLKAFCERYDIQLLAIDQFSLMDDARKNKIRNEKFESISMDLKILQTQLEIPIICVAQLNRGIEKGEDPDTTNIAGSDRIAQDATTILSIQQKDNHRVVLQIMKARDAKVGDKLTYIWDIDTGTFEYIPMDTEPQVIKEQNKCEELSQKYGNDNPF